MAAAVLLVTHSDAWDTVLLAVASSATSCNERCESCAISLSWEFGSNLTLCQDKDGTRCAAGCSNNDSSAPSSVTARRMSLVDWTIMALSPGSIAITYNTMLHCHQ